MYKNKFVRSLIIILCSFTVWLEAIWNDPHVSSKHILRDVALII
jgi:hypothetical protein